MQKRGNLIIAALIAVMGATGAARASTLYTQTFDGAAGTQPAADPIWRTHVVLGGGDTAVTQNDGAGEYEHRFAAGTAGDIRMLGYYNNPDDTDRGVWRDTDISALMSFTGGATNLTGLAFRATDNAAAVSTGSYYHVRVDGSTLELFRNLNGSFASIGSATGGAFAGATQRLITVSVNNVSMIDVDDVHIVATLYNGTTVGSGILRQIDVTDTSINALTTAGGVGFRTAFQGGSPPQRSGFDNLTVTSINPDLLWYDDYFQNTAPRMQSFVSGVTQSVTSNKYSFADISNGDQARATLNFDSYTSTAPWENVAASAMMRWSTGGSTGRIEAGLVIRETDMTSTADGDYYFFALIRNEDANQSAARIYRVINGVLGTEIAGVLLSNALTPESTNLFLSFMAVTNALGFVELVGVASLNADLSNPFASLSFTDTAANRILGPGSAGFRLGGSGTMNGTVNFDSFTVVHVPAPAALPAGLGLAALVAMRRRRRQPSRSGYAKPTRLERHARPMGLAAVVAMMLMGASAARAAMVSEYFDNYGTTPLTTLEGKAGGVGWLSDWRDSTVGTFESDRVGYEAVNNSFVNPNYVGGGETGSNDGRARIETADGSGSILRRSFATGLTGTVWMSAIIRHESNTAGDILFWFETTTSGVGPNTFIGLRTGDTPTLRHGGENTSAADIGQTSTNLLVLARIELDFAGTFDRISFWIKNESDDLSSIAALGSPLLSEGDENLFGSALTFIGLSGGGANGNIDNLRYADGADAFAFILGGAAAIPAPAALPAGLGLIGLLAVRRRRNRST